MIKTSYVLKNLLDNYILNILFRQNLFLVLLEIYEKTLNQFQAQNISHGIKRQQIHLFIWLFLKINWHKNIFINLKILASFTYFTHMPHFCY